MIAVSPEIYNSSVAARIRFASTMPDKLRQNQRVTVRVTVESKANTLLVERGNFLGGGRIAYVWCFYGVVKA